MRNKAHQASIRLAPIRDQEAASWSQHTDHFLRCLPHLLLVQITFFSKLRKGEQSLVSPLPLLHLMLPTLSLSGGNDLNSVAIFEDL